MPNPVPLGLMVQFVRVVDAMQTGAEMAFAAPGSVGTGSPVAPKGVSR
ncbi:hypothetical protein [Mycolicibacterium iranicum]|nr:hypothetical protein [Mycolicibacterium iranicum]